MTKECKVRFKMQLKALGTWRWAVNCATLFRHIQIAEVSQTLLLIWSQIINCFQSLRMQSEIQDAVEGVRNTAVGSQLCNVLPARSDCGSISDPSVDLVSNNQLFPIHQQNNKFLAEFQYLFGLFRLPHKTKKT